MHIIWLNYLDNGVSLILKYLINCCVLSNLTTSPETLTTIYSWLSKLATLPESLVIIE